MNLLLDTKALLWWLDGGGRLRVAAREAIENSGNELWVSAVTVWEIAVKNALGRLRPAAEVLAAT